MVVGSSVASNCPHMPPDASKESKAQAFQKELKTRIGSQNKDSELQAVLKIAFGAPSAIF